MRTEAEEFLLSEGLILDREPYSFNHFDTAQWHLHFTVREKYIERFGFAIPNEAALEAIATAAPILEAGAGSGYWAHELKKFGVDIVATDPGTGCYHGLPNKGFWNQDWHTVEKLTATEAIKAYPTRNILTVWPDLHGNWPTRMLRSYRGKHLFYVGEGDGGCTGNDAFHQHLDKHYELVQEITIPQFESIHDRLFCYSRKS